MTERSNLYLASLVDEYVKLPRETEWLEFKVDNTDPEEIGEYVSALANGAALASKPNGYVIWGVADGTHEIVGTTFSPRSTKVGNEELENWLLRSLTPRIMFEFFDVTIEGRSVVILQIACASKTPVQFKGQEFVRIGTYKKKLKDFPELERRLWRIFETLPFERQIARERATGAEVIEALEHTAYFDLLGLPLPNTSEGILRALESDALITESQTGGWNITNLGAVLFARKLEEWPSLKRKAARVIQYSGNSRVATLRERAATRGYAPGFKPLLAYVDLVLPSVEVVGQASRRTVRTYPGLVIRELIANALIHQDFEERGSGPMIEVFEDRVEITNPGRPLMDPQRLVDTPPRSRNEALAALMRRIGFCEERGSGWDKVVAETELNQLPAPLAEVTDNHLRVVVFGPRKLQEMDKADKIRAVYLHACLKYVNRQFLTNSSVRERFGIEAQNSALASRLIKDAVFAGFIEPQDPAAGYKYMKYQPFWAHPQSVATP